MEKRIIYKTIDNKVAVVVPSPDSGMTIEQIAAKDVPSGAIYEIVNVSEIPSDRTFREAWVWE